MTDKMTILPDWIDFERDYVATGIPHLFVVRPSPSVTLFVDQGAERLGARFETAAPQSENLGAMPAEIHVEDVISEGARAVEIWTESQDLFQNFYQLACEIIVTVVDDGADPSIALHAAVARWEALLSRPSLMSEEAQAGLFGELWLLYRLVGSFGSDAVESWVGPVPQPHDFRWGDVELEVKTTSSALRVHTINGIGQLQPTLDCKLYLLSLKLANAGTGGCSLPEAVAAVEAALSSAPSALTRFRAGLEANGYDPSHAHRYSRRRRLRDCAMLIEVADGAPRLTADALRGIDARFAPERLGRIVYKIDVEGMGVSDGSDDFHAVIPPKSPNMREPFDV